VFIGVDIMNTFKDQVIESLNVLELNNEKIIDDAILKKAYLKMSKKYHPDVCLEQYKDGVMFKKVNEAHSFIKDNMQVVNDYLANPSKFEYQNTYQNNPYSNQTYQNTNQFYENLFRQFFQNANFRTTYTKEEMAQIQKERKRRIFKRRLFASLGVVFAVLLTILSPALGMTTLLFSLFMLL